MESSKPGISVRCDPVIAEQFPPKINQRTVMVRETVGRSTVADNLDDFIRHAFLFCLRFMGRPFELAIVFAGCNQNRKLPGSGIDHLRIAEPHIGGPKAAFIGIRPSTGIQNIRVESISLLLQTL